MNSGIQLSQAKVEGYRVMGCYRHNVTNLSILPGMGKIKLTAGSPEWGTRGTQALPHYTTRFGVEIQGERPLSHGYAFGITRG